MNYNNEEVEVAPPAQSIAERLRTVLEDVEIKGQLPISGLPTFTKLTYGEISEVIATIDRAIVKISASNASL